MRNVATCLKNQSKVFTWRLVERMKCGHDASKEEKPENVVIIRDGKNPVGFSPLRNPLLTHNLCWTVSLLQKHREVKSHGIAACRPRPCTGGGPAGQLFRVWRNKYVNISFGWVYEFFFTPTRLLHDSRGWRNLMRKSTRSINIHKDTVETRAS